MNISLFKTSFEYISGGDLPSAGISSKINTSNKF
jgi:hypothetical protein